MPCDAAMPTSERQPRDRIDRRRATPGWGKANLRRVDASVVCGLPVRKDLTDTCFVDAMLHWTLSPKRCLGLARRTARTHHRACTSARVPCVRRSQNRPLPPASVVEMLCGARLSVGCGTCWSGSVQSGGVQKVIVDRRRDAQDAVGARKRAVYSELCARASRWWNFLCVAASRQSAEHDQGVELARVGFECFRPRHHTLRSRSAKPRRHRRAAC